MNIPELERLLYDFYQISGMEVAILDTKHHTILSHRSPGKNFCGTIHKHPKCLEVCIQSDRLRLNHVEENKRLLTYICPFGIFEAIAPIMKDGNVIAYIFFAMAIEEKEGGDDFPARRVLELAPTADAEYLRQCIIEIPHYSRKTLEAYSDLLLIMAEYIEKYDLMSNNEQTLAQVVRRYIDKNLSSKITLADLSWNLHCSTVTLTEHFKREFGITIMQYVTQKRMQMAEQMLLGSHASINEIASTCGFADVEYFSRTFKGIHGISPNRWRQMQREERTEG
ncbi:MAG: helix-turn-helix domain-containing protein [Ruminococcaceae bacterium]|nr:helix-turn-helix domain-containing protein [Oscillospiraceae bacterium]